MIKIYAAGGSGINIGTTFLERYIGDTNALYPIHITYLDTSQSNLSKIRESNNSDVFLLEDSNGSGKKRDLNYNELDKRAQVILREHKPDKINIILHSLSGGSGSIIGPILARELISKNLPVIIIGIGSTDSKVEIYNTIKTLETYELISRKRGKPINLMYYENNKITPRKHNDDSIQAALELLTIFFNDENLEMDYQDLVNFLNYPEVTGHSCKLQYMEAISGNNISIAKNSVIISLATLSDPNTDTVTNLLVDYQATGYLTEALRTRISTLFNIEMPIHLAIIDGIMSTIVERLRSMESEYNEAFNANVISNLVIDSSSAKDGEMLF